MGLAVTDGTATVICQPQLPGILVWKNGSSFLPDRIGYAISVRDRRWIEIGERVIHNTRRILRFSVFEPKFKGLWSNSAHTRQHHPTKKCCLTADTPPFPSYFQQRRLYLASPKFISESLLRGYIRLGGPSSPNTIFLKDLFSFLFRSLSSTKRGEITTTTHGAEREADNRR